MALCATTAMGRKNINIVAETITKKYNGHLVYGDSVTGDEPLLLLNSKNEIEIKTIENLSNEWQPYENFKPFDTIRSNRREKQKLSFNIKFGQMVNGILLKKLLDIKQIKKYIVSILIVV